jgi:cytochrome d ubiquinol oxidase subunit I
MMRDGKPWFDAAGNPIMRAEITDFWAVVFSPSSMQRLTHTLIGAFIMGAFFIMSISAWYLLKRKHEEFARRSFSGALLFATIFSLTQLFSGHQNAKMVANEQPAKLAAFEGHFKTGVGNLSLVGFPDVSQQRTNYEIAVPGLLSWLIYGDARRAVTGLDRVPRADWPPVAASFQIYHAMVALGMFFIVLTLLASFLRWRGVLFNQRWLLWIFVLSVVLAMAANQLGWAAAEVGRQPWTVYPRIQRTADGEFALDAQGMMQYRPDEGLLTKNAVSEVVTAPEVLGSIIMFGMIYLLLGAIWLIVLNHKIQHGPEPVAIPTTSTPGGFIGAVAQLAEHDGSMTEAKAPQHPE